MTEQWDDLVQGVNGTVKIKRNRTYTLSSATLYNLRPGSPTPDRDPAGATIPAPNAIIQNITSSGLTIVVGITHDGQYEVSENGHIILITSDPTIVIDDRDPETTLVLDLVSVDSASGYSLTQRLTATTLAATS